MTSKSIRQLLESLDQIEQGNTLIQTESIKVRSKEILTVKEWTPVNEFIAPLARLAGTALAGAAGSAIYDKFKSNTAGSSDSSMLGLNKDGSSDKTDTSGNNIQRSTIQSQSRSVPSDAELRYKDSLGNKIGDYQKMPNLIPITANLPLKSPGSLADELDKVENGRGTNIRVIKSWQFKNSTLAIATEDRGNGFYSDVSTIATDFSGFDKDMKKLLGDLGYRYQGLRTGVISTSLGNAFLEEITATKGLFKKMIFLGAFNMIPFEANEQKGLHLIQCNFLGPMSDFTNGGKDMWIQLTNSLRLTPGITLLSNKKS